MAKVSDKFKMEGIAFIAHGGPGSGRYPKGSGKNPRSAYKRLRKIAKKDYKYRTSDQQRLMSKYMNEDQQKSLTDSGSNLHKSLKRVYNNSGYVRKSATKDDAKVLTIAEKRHKDTVEKIANEILGKYGSTPISVVHYGQPSIGKKMQKTKSKTTAKSYLFGTLYAHYNK